ncbi:MAG: sensor histidine kinase [Blautia sp.]|jgi:two-component system sensor histidine kinase YesM
MKKETAGDLAADGLAAVYLLYELLIQKNALLFLGLLLLFLYMVQKQRRMASLRQSFQEEVARWKKKAEQREITAHRSDCEEEIRWLQNQINPHFLYNTLDSIRGQALAVGEGTLADMVEALSAFFRYSISRRGNIVTLEDEIRNVKTYVQIQQFRFEDRFDLEIEMDASEDVMECLIPKMTLQPIIENAIFHGVELSMAPGKVLVRIVETQERLLIYVIDNGVGMSKEKVRRLNESLNEWEAKRDDTCRQGEGKGMALRNVNERIRIYYGNLYGISIYSTENVGTQVEIRLPAIKDEKVGRQMQNQDGMG